MQEGKEAIKEVMERCSEMSPGQGRTFGIWKRRVGRSENARKLHREETRSKREIKKNDEGQFYSKEKIERIEVNKKGPKHELQRNA